MLELGGHAVVLREGELQLAAASRRATPRWSCRAWSTRSASAPGPHELVEELAEHSRVPVVNMLTRDHHPCQALADLLTLRERFGRLDGLRLAYVGDGNNVAHSLLLAGAKAGVEVAVGTPPELLAAGGAGRRSAAEAVAAARTRSTPTCG